MEEIIFSDWGPRPSSAGAYWMKDNKAGVSRICQVVKINSKFWITLPNVEGGLPAENLDGIMFSFFGPLSLPEGQCLINDEAFYKEMDAPVEPTDDVHS